MVDTNGSPKRPALSRPDDDREFSDNATQIDAKIDDRILRFSILELYYDPKSNSVKPGELLEWAARKKEQEEEHEKRATERHARMGSAVISIGAGLLIALAAKIPWILVWVKFLTFFQ